MLVTSDDEVARRARILRDQGQVEKYVHVELGYNYRLTSLQAAIGRVQLRKLEKLNEIRRRNAYYLTSRLSRVKGLVTPYEDPRAVHVYHQYVVRVTGDFPLTRDQLRAELAERGVETAIHYPMPVHHQPLYRKLGYDPRECFNAVEASKTVLSLPVHPLLTQEDLDYIAKAVEEVASGS